MKNHNRLAILACSVALILSILACNAPLASPSADVAALVAQTQTAIALEAFLTSTASAEQVTPSATPTQIPQPSISPSPQASLPSGATRVPGCTDMAKYEAETIPDGTAFPPGQEFMKTWTFRNVGTCIWTPDYSLVFVKGEQMGGTSPSPIGQTVPPNGTIQIYLPQKAPDQSGEHQGYWKLRNTQGSDFGLGQAADVAFWVKILVQPGATSGSPPNLGAPTWTESFDSKNTPFYLGDDSDIGFQVKDGSLVMTAFEPAGDQWRVAQNRYLDDFYLEARFRTGSACSGKDSYGLIVRAPDQPDGIIDSGYVFGFSCDGMYRAYLMNSGNYNGIANWTGHSILQAGPNQANSMGVRAVGDQLQLYANGMLVLEFTDSSFGGGLFGLVIRSDSTQNFQAFVDQIDYWDLSP